jgi:hypothetical protein
MGWPSLVPFNVSHERPKAARFPDAIRETRPSILAWQPSTIAYNASLITFGTLDYHRARIEPRNVIGANLLALIGH